MRYLGGKKLIADELASIITPYITETYFEPFCGGLWVSVAIAKKCKSSTVLFLSDIHPDLIMLYSALYKDKIELPEYVTEEQYKEYRHKKSSALRGFIGFGCSFGGKWFGGYARDNTQRNYFRESRDRLLKTFSVLRNFQIYFACQSYLELSPEDSTIYCDPPYRDTTVYNKIGIFNHDEYYTKVQELATNNHVFCSEYSMPIGNEIWQKEKTVAVNKDNRAVKNIERLYKI